MTDLSRRRFLLRGGLAAAAGVAGASLALAQDVEPTKPSGKKGDHLLGEEFGPTEDNILGPFHRPGAPYRAKICPPFEPGTVMLVTGRVWSHVTRRPLASAIVDIWQADARGRYDNDDPKHPPAGGVFKNRARMITAEDGSYEYETIHPGRYKIGRDVWRPAHVHYMVRAAGHAELVTQLYFAGDPMNATDALIKPSLIIQLEERKTRGHTYEAGNFDIVLAGA